MDKILEVKNLKISFRTDNGTLKAVRDVSFNLERGKTTAIVGESGSGKSVTSKAILGILAGNAIVEGGKILYDGKDLLQIGEDEMYRIRGDKISMIFQDPLSSLNPIMRIGKQITEAMMLKSKAHRRDARNDFNTMLSLLKKNMISACPESSAEIETMIKTFDKFCILSTKLEGSYNKAYEAAEELAEDIGDFLFQMSKKQKLNSKAILGEIIHRLGTVKDFFLTADYDDQLTKATAELKALRSGYRQPAKSAPGQDLPQEIRAKLEYIQAMLEKMTAQVRPDFFRIGYYRLCNSSENLASRDISELNEMTLRYLNEHFMDRFLELMEKGVEYSYKAALSKKKECMGHFEKAKNYFSGDITKAGSAKEVKELADLVEASINKLEITKDSAAYTFRTSMTGALSKYFLAVVNNPKEEARYAKQSKRRDAKIARGKNVDWKVVPKVVFDLDDMKKSMVDTISELEQHFADYISKESTKDFHADSVDIIDYQKKMASEVVCKVTKAMAKAKALKIMEEVGISEPRRRFKQYPFEFSGGMRQRIVIAIALAADPEILICDEPTTALDVTIQAQILELINRLKEKHNLSVIFITHDLGVVANMADDIAVMYAGKIVEYGTADDIFYDPRHPYTWALLSSMPDLDTNEKLDAIPGTPPNMIYPPVGDAFAERNKYALKIDFEMQPPMFRISDTHWAATWLLHPNAPKVETPKAITDRIARMMKAGGASHEQ